MILRYLKIQSDLKIILSAHQNNYVERFNVDDVAKNFTF